MNFKIYMMRAMLCLHGTMEYARAHSRVWVSTPVPAGEARVIFLLQLNSSSEFPTFSFGAGNCSLVQQRIDDTTRILPASHQGPSLKSRHILFV